MNAIFLVKRLALAGSLVVGLTLAGGTAAAAAARIETPGAFAPFTAAAVLLLGVLALALCCGRRT